MKGLRLWLLAGLVSTVGCVELSRLLGPIKDSIEEIKEPFSSAEEPDWSAPRFSIEASDRKATLSFPDYTMAIQYREPFGMVALKMAGQKSDFVHHRLPLGDWEWFKIDLNKRGSWLKLIMPDWNDPEVEVDGDVVVFRFYQRDAIVAGITLEVEYRIQIDRPEFDIEYSIHNSSWISLTAPYVMLGFPGFSNHGEISSIQTALQDRVPENPHDNFLDEALEVGKEEYLLLRHDTYPRLDPTGALKGTISIAESGRIFTLESSLVPDESYTYVYSAHTNKPGYLTSHLYAFLEDIPRGQTTRVTIHYALSREDGR